MTIVAIFIKIPSKEPSAWIKKRETWASILVAANKTNAITMQKEKAFLAAHIFNSNKKRIEKKSQNTGLDTTKLKLLNSFKYVKNLSLNACQFILFIPIGNPSRERF